MNLYILKGEQVVEEPNLPKWTSWFESAKRTIKKEYVTPEILVSTVFLGIDHTFGEGKLPILFETMIFGGNQDQNCWRYSTYTQAVEGHKEVVAMFDKGEK